MGRQTPWPSQIRPWPLIVKSSHDQTWSHITSYDHFRPVNVTLFSIRTHFIPTQFPEKWCTSVCSLLHAYHSFYTKFTEFQINLLSFSHTHLTLHVKKNPFTTHYSLSTYSLVHFFTLGLEQLSASTLTHVSWYKLLLVARYGDCKKIIKDLLYKTKIDVQTKWFLCML